MKARSPMLRSMLSALLAALALGAAPEAHAAAAGPRRVKSEAERVRMKEFVDRHVDRRDVVESFQDDGGQTFDCVPLYAQPALKRPELRGHRIELAPRTLPVEPASDVPPRGHVFDPDAGRTGPADQERLPAPRCRPGTVPVRRLALDDLERFETLEDFHRKAPRHLASTGSEFLPQAGASDLHQHAAARQVLPNYGAVSTLNLWSPSVERSNEFSLSQIWVVGGTGSSTETVEAGWQVFPTMYDDAKARFFIYFTPDNYGSGGCYNLDCSGFVQVSNQFTIGGTFSSYSTAGGSQKYATLEWYKDGSGGDWWLRRSGVWVGYYPRSLFDATGISYTAQQVHFGGEIIDDRTNFWDNLWGTAARHTKTDMGSGRKPSSSPAAAHYGFEAFQRRVRVIGTHREYRAASLDKTDLVTDPDCYDLVLLSSSDSDWEQYFYFGGTGYSTSCN